MLNLSKKEWEYDKKDFESLKDLLKDLKLLLSSRHLKEWICCAKLEESQLKEMSIELKRLFKKLSYTRAIVKASLDYYVDNVEPVNSWYRASTEIFQYSSADKFCAENLLDFIKDYKSLIIWLKGIETEDISDIEVQQIRELIYSKEDGLQSIVNKGVEFYKKVFANDTDALNKLKENKQNLSSEELESLLTILK